MNKSFIALPSAIVNPAEIAAIERSPRGFFVSLSNGRSLSLSREEAEKLIEELHPIRWLDDGEWISLGRKTSPTRIRLETREGIIIALTLGEDAALIPDAIAWGQLQFERDRTEELGGDRVYVYREG